MTTPDEARDYQAEADAYLLQLIDGLSPDEQGLALTVLANRAAIRLNNIGRAQSTDRKGEADWPVWAGLANAARSMVLQSSSARDLAAKLTGRRR